METHSREEIQAAKDYSNKLETMPLSLTQVKGWCYIDFLAGIDYCKKEHPDSDKKYDQNELNSAAMKFYKKHHGILDSGNMQTVAKFIEELLNPES